MGILEKIRTFHNGSKVNQGIIYGILTIAFFVPFYFMFMAKSQKEGRAENLDSREHFDTGGRENFQSARPGYYTNRPEEKSKIQNEGDFFKVDEFQKQVDTLRRTVEGDMVPTSPEDSTEVERLRALILEQQRIADSKGGVPISVPAKKNNMGSGGVDVTEVQTTTSSSGDEYYRRLQEAKADYFTDNGDISRGTRVSEDFSSGNQPPGILVRAVFYKDQSVLPGDRVRFLLAEDMVHQGKLFRRNTVVYAIVGIEGSRVHLDIENINGSPVSLMAMDIDDRLPGIYSEQAGNLWREFQNNNDNVAGDAVSEGVGDVVNNTAVNRLVRSVGQFFKGKRKNQADKILLVNTQEFLLTDK